MERHERHEALVVAPGVGVGDQRDLLQEHVERVRAGRSARVELAADLHELLQVLDPALGLDRAFCFERLDVARLGEDRFEQVSNRDALLGALAQRGHCRHEALVGPDRRGPQPRHGGGLGRRVPDRDPHRLSVRRHARLRRLADPPLGRVRDARERHHVLRVREHRQVRDRVLDLGALVELRPADDLVGDLAAHERVLEHPRLRVRPVEDRELRAGDALVHEPLDLPDDEPGLRVLVVKLPHLYGIALAEVGPEVLAHPAAVVADHRVGGIEDGLRRAVVLLEADDLGIREVVPEIQDVRDVGAAEAVDRVVRDQSAGDEVVRVLDVEVVHRGVELDALNRLHDVVATVLGEHDHARPDRAGRCEGQGRALRRRGIAPTQPCDTPHVDVEHGRDPACDLQHLPRVLEA